MRLFLPLLLFVGLAVLLFLGLGRDPREVPSPLVGKPAAAFDLPELRSDTGERVSTSQFAGRPWLLNVWGSWCVACQEEHPVLLEYARSKQIPLVGLNWKDDPETARRWLAELGDPYDAIAFDGDGRIAIDYGVYGAPETFFIDAAGRITHKHIGPLTAEVLRAQIEPLLQPGNAP